jgi:hypothetical protein
MTMVTAVVEKSENANSTSFEILTFLRHAIAVLFEIHAWIGIKYKNGGNELFPINSETKI